MTIVFYSSGHGFGHASRDLEVINAVRQVAPQARIVMRTTVPQWFLDASRLVPLEVHSVETDTGIAQIGGLALDEDETARRAATFYARFPSRVTEEAAALRDLHATIVVGDIPPLAFAAAAAAQVPSVALGNFTWDWIYRGYREFEAAAPGVVSLIADAYSTATVALRLPFHGGFESIRGSIQDVPLVARRAHRRSADTRRLLGIGRDERVVLASFGGHEVDIPWPKLGGHGRFTLLLTDYELRHSSVTGLAPHIRCFRRDELTVRGIRYEDLVAASDVVLAKAGYGIVSECIANGSSLLYTSRGRFAEHDVLVAEMPRVLRCRYIAQEDLLQGRLADAVDALLEQSAPSIRLDAGGAEIAAATILRLATDRAAPSRLSP